MTRRTITLLITCALFLFGLCACESQTNKDGGCDRVSIAVAAWPGSIPLYVANEKGFFKDEGLEVFFQLYSSGQAALPAMLAGKSDLATAADTPIAVATVGKQPISIVATIAEIKHGIVLVARKDRGIATADDLKGKTVGVTLGSSAEFFLHVFLAISYIDPADVHIVDIKPDEMVEALLSGKIDAVCAWPPYKDRLMEKLGANAFILDEPGAYTVSWNIVGRPVWLEAHPGCATKLLRALIRASEYIVENPREARSIAARYIGPESPLFIGDWDDYSFVVKLDQSLILNLEDQARWIIRNSGDRNLRQPDFLDHIYFQGLKKVQPEAVTILGE